MKCPYSEKFKGCKVRKSNDMPEFMWGQYLPGDEPGIICNITGDHCDQEVVWDCKLYNDELGVEIMNSLYENFTPINPIQEFNEYLDYNYSLEDGPLVGWDYSYVFNTIDPVAYEVMKTDYLRERYIKYKDEYWKIDDFNEAIWRY